MVFGLAAGDALGVPVEFKSREFCRRQPVTGMQGFGSHLQPAGTWSDDSSMTFCTMEAMLGEFEARQLGNHFLRWIMDGWWTPHGDVFDKGLATTAALQRLHAGVHPEEAGGMDEMSNGNGSLMRISPLAWHPVQEEEAFFRLVKQVSSLTHRHLRSVMACHFYLEYLRLLLGGAEKEAGFFSLQQGWKDRLLRILPGAQSELPVFDKVLDPGFAGLPESGIQSEGYVMHSLEAAVWSFLNTDSCPDALLKAVNLGGDTDTTGAVCGALAGAYYGFGSLPSEWVSVLARQDEIEALCIRFYEKYA